jgi:uncharacterized protein (DUF885 family)
MKKALLPLAVSFALAAMTGCSDSQTQASATNSAVTAEASTTAAAVKLNFNQYSQLFIDQLWQLSPTWALYSGKHVNDGYLEIPNQASRDQTLAFVTQQQKALSQFDPQALTTNELIDYKLLTNLVESMKWDIERLKAWKWDPSNYNVAGGFAQIINEDFAPLDERLSSVIARLENVPAYYDAARSNISDPTLEHTQLAIMQNQGAFSVLSDALVQQVADSGLSTDQKTLFNQRFDAATAAIKQHLEWLTALETKLTENGGRDFRIGETLYEEKFAFDIQSGMTKRWRIKIMFNKKWLS